MEWIRRLRRTLLVTVAVGLGASASQAAPVNYSVLVSNVGTNSVLKVGFTVDTAAGTNPTGLTVATFAANPTLQAPFGLTYGPDNNLYVAGLGTGAILRFNGTTGAAMPAAGQTRATFVAPGTVAQPNNIVFANGYMYVDDFNNGKILQFQGPGGASPGALVNGTWATISPASGVNGRPTGMLFDANTSNTVDGNGKNIYVSASNLSYPNVIQQVPLATPGTQVNFVGSGTAGKQVVAPAGLAIQSQVSGSTGILWGTSFANTTNDPSAIVAYNYNDSSPGQDGKFLFNITHNDYAALLGPAAIEPLSLYTDTLGHVHSTMLVTTNFDGSAANSKILYFDIDVTQSETNFTGGKSASFKASILADSTNGILSPTYIAMPPTGVTLLAIALPEPGSVVLLGVGSVGVVVYALGCRRTAK